MALLARGGPRGRAARRERGSDLWLAHAGAVQGTRGEESAGRGPREPDPQGPRALAEDLSDRGRYPARQRTRLAQYLYPLEEPRGIPDYQARSRSPGCGRATRHRGDFRREAVRGME